MTEIPLAVKEKIAAAFDLVGRTGAESCGIRFQDDEEPTVWIGIASYSGDRHEVSAALDPLRAMLRLCEQLIDGGKCVHCGRPSGLEPDSIDTMPMNELICWYQWDPELKTFRRGCEGDERPFGIGATSARKGTE